MSLQIREEAFNGFSAVIVEWLDRRLAVTPTIGGRILGFSYRGQEAFYTMPSLIGKQFDLAVSDGDSVQQRRAELGMKLYGGFKTWLAPQSLWGNSPYIDLDLAPYELEIEREGDGCTLRLTGPVCRETGMQFIRTVSVSGDRPEVTVEMGMANRGMESVSYGLWDVTQLNSPASVYFPTGRDDVKSWSIPVSGDAREPFEWFSDSLTTVRCGQDNGVFKVGTRYSEGWLLCVIPTGAGALGYVKRFPHFDGKQCGHGCAIEVYNSGEYPYLEAEVHSPLVTLSPGQSYSFTQTWELNPLPDGAEAALEFLKGGGTP